MVLVMTSTIAVCSVAATAWLAARTTTSAIQPEQDPVLAHAPDISRAQVRSRGLGPAIARRGTRHGTGLGTYRWVVERSFAWLHGFRRLRIRWERRADIHEGDCCRIR